MTRPSAPRPDPRARTSRAGLSSRSPWNDGARRWPSCVHSANSTSHTSFGFTHTTSPLRTFGIFGTSANGGVSVRSGSSFASSSSMSCSVNPVPQLPTQRELVAAVAPSTSEPKLPGAAALALRPAADDELLAAVRLDLEPVARALALGVARAAAASPSRPRAPARPPPRRAPRRRRRSRRPAPFCSRLSSSASSRSRRSSSGRSTTGTPSTSSRSKTS